MGLALKHQPQYTYEDYKLWEGNWELIEGIPFAMSPSPSFDHQSIEMDLGVAFNSALKGCTRCKVIPQMDWKISENTIVCPDLAVYCKPFEAGAFMATPPLVALEILSVSSLKKDRELKFEIYEANNVKYYVIVNPFKKIIEIYILKEGKYTPVFEAENGNFIFELTDCKAEVNFDGIWP